MSVLHQDWSPPAPGQTPTLKVSRSSAELLRLHQAIGELTLRARNTVVVHYCQRLSVAEQAALLDCQPKTVEKRVESIHRQLLGVLDDA
jgi:DNA-directed RNA polymerase specialized sigma24 family protein